MAADAVAEMCPGSIQQHAEVVSRHAELATGYLRFAFLHEPQLDHTALFGRQLFDAFTERASKLGCLQPSIKSGMRGPNLMQRRLLYWHHARVCSAQLGGLATQDSEQESTH